jgi:hypothetical protein
MSSAGQDFAHDDVFEGRRTGGDNALDFEAEEGDGAGDLVDRGVERDVILKPVQEKLSWQENQE